MFYGKIFFYVGTDLMIHVKLIEEIHLRSAEEKTFIAALCFLDEVNDGGFLSYSIGFKNVISWLLPLTLLDWCLDNFKTKCHVSIDTTRLKTFKETAEIFNSSTLDLITEMEKNDQYNRSNR